VIYFIESSLAWDPRWILGVDLTEHQKAVQSHQEAVQLHATKVNEQLCQLASNFHKEWQELCGSHDTLSGKKDLDALIKDGQSDLQSFQQRGTELFARYQTQLQNVRNAAGPPPPPTPPPAPVVVPKFQSVADHEDAKYIRFDQDDNSLKFQDQKLPWNSQKAKDWIVEHKEWQHITNGLCLVDMRELDNLRPLKKGNVNLNLINLEESLWAIVGDNWALCRLIAATAAVPTTTTVPHVIAASAPPALPAPSAPPALQATGATPSLRGSTICIASSLLASVREDKTGKEDKRSNSTASSAPSPSPPPPPPPPPSQKEGKLIASVFLTVRTCPCGADLLKTCADCERAWPQFADVESRLLAASNREIVSPTTKKRRASEIQTASATKKSRPVVAAAPSTSSTVYQFSKNNKLDLRSWVPSGRRDDQRIALFKKIFP
jgi:hypothetical protein